MYQNIYYKRAILLIGNKRVYKIYEKNILKKFIVLFSLVILLNINIVHADKVGVIIRSGGTVVYSDFYDLPPAGDTIVLDKSEVERTINARSVLAVLSKIDQTNDSFSLSNLNYDDYYKSLYLKCLTPENASELCDNWQYVVNDTYPDVGMDKYILDGNEKIYLYFGPQDKLILNKDTIDTTESLIVTAQKYDYENNNWIAKTDTILGLTQTNPEGPETQVGPVDKSGQRIFSPISVGSYNVGIKVTSEWGSYYWPTEKLTVTKFVSSGGGHSSGSYIIPQVKLVFSIEKAISFLLANQKSDGSFGSPMHTDWVAVAVSAGNSSSLKSSILNYIKSNFIDSSVITDNERRAMALMALGINPYSGTEINYIKKIVDGFDGTQFGDKNLDNDDIFALIVLQNAGYDQNDEIIKKNISYLISKQGADGGWGSVDMTSAGIQALRSFKDVAGVSDSILKAGNYFIGKKQVDGGFGNSFSNSWILQSMLGDSRFSNLEDYLAKAQQADGGLENITSDINTRIWATAYAVPAILYKSWNDILIDFPKQVEIVTPLLDVNKEEIKNVIKTARIAIEKEEENIQNPSSQTPQISNSTIYQTASVGLLPAPIPNIIISTFNHIWAFVKSPFLWLWYLL